MKRLAAWALVLLALVAGGVSGCGTPAAPQPPSLRLPGPVTDLSAVRAGDNVTLRWTMPKRDTDKIALKGPVAVTVCRKEQQGQGWSACAQVGSLALDPGKDGQFVDRLQGGMVAGAARPVQYFVELKNKHGRSAGLSNGAVMVAGAAPEPVAGFGAVLHPEGVKLTWTAAAEGEPVRLIRTFISSTEGKKDKEPAEQRLMVDADGGKALDADARYGSTYEYRAERIVRIEVQGGTVELGGEISAPVRIDVEDVFPPGVPQGLAAVTAAVPGQPLAIDLSWTPRTDRNLAGYVVDRSEGGGAWQRISPAEPVVGPAFHDAHVEAGRTYRYTVRSVSHTGHESAASAAAEETTPTAP